MRSVRGSLVLPFGVALALATASLAGSPATSASHRPCPTTGATLVRNSQARIWSSDHHYGCAFRVGRVVRLDPTRGQLIASKPKVKLAGAIAAYETMDFNLRPFRVVVRDLRTGSTIHTATSNAGGSADGHTGPVRRVILARSGSVAWTASVDCVCEGVDYSTGFEVHKIGHDNQRVILDTGPAVDPLSLKLTAGQRRAEWKHAGATRSARLG